MSSFLAIRKTVELSSDNNSHMFVGRQCRSIPQPPSPIPTKPYDAEVEYLESTGTQWIDTGITASTT